MRINRKEKRAAIRHLLIEKILDNRLHVLKFEEMKEPKTKSVASFLKAMEMSGKRVLFLGDGLVKEGDKFGTFIRSLRNIPKSEFALVPNVNGYELIVNHDLVVMDSALDQLKILLGGQK